MTVSAEAIGAGPLIGYLDIQGTDLIFQHGQAVVKVFKIVHRFEGNLHPVGGGQGSEGGIALIMQKDDLFNTQLADIFDHPGKPLLENLRVCEMDIDHIAEKFLSEETGGHDIFEKFALGNFPQLGHEAEGKGDLPDLAQLKFPPGFPDIDPLSRNGPWGRDDAFILPPFVDEVKGVIAPSTVFLAGVAGDAIPKDRGILAPEDPDHLFPGRILFKIHILTFNQTGAVRTGQASVFIELQCKHSDPLSKVNFAFFFPDRIFNPGA